MIPGVVAHLWQSTWFALSAWLFALALRTNRAQVRYWVWFAASAKFLLPFSLLIALGTLVPHRPAAPPIRPAWMAALQELSQPLPLPAAPTHFDGAVPVEHYGHLREVALTVWACGFAAIIICWALRWMRVRAVLRTARAVTLPAASPIPVPVMSAPGLIEPGIFGVLRPVLLLPEGVVGRLDQAQLESILAHEFSHVRRKDNLTAAIHMAVQAIFWFHPLTWWIGARLVDERERACDEEVLRVGYKPAVYAESILLVCRWYLSSPLACLSGVTGSNLTKRIESIMTNRPALHLHPGKKLALGIAAMAALIVPILIGALNAPALQAQDAADWQTKAGGKRSFEVASVKPSQGAFVAPNVPMNAGESYRPTGGLFRADFPLWTYIQFAYKLQPAADQAKETLAHLPKWVTTDRYTVEARAAGNPTKDQMRLMVQSLLAERFQLAAHFESKDMPVFTIALVKPGVLGPNLRSHAEGRPCDPSAPGNVPVPAPVSRGDVASSPQNFPPMCDSFALIRKANGALMLAGYRNATAEMLAASLQLVLESRPVIDKTGLTGRYDFTLEWAPESKVPPPLDPTPSAPDPVGPTPLQALRDQLGLKLESARGPVQILVIDKMERPSEN